MLKMNSARTGSVALILLVLLLGPFFRGLFFPVPLLATVTVVAVAFGLWIYGRRQDRLGLGLPGGWEGALLLALVGVYLLQFGWASYARGNLDWLLRALAAWMAFVVIRQESTPKSRRWLGWTLVASAAAVSLIGFLEYGAFFEAAHALKELLNIKGLGMGDRIYSAFQYPNAGAAFLLVSAFLGNSLMLTEESLRHRLGLAALSGLIALGFFFTLSRGALLVLPVVLLLWVIGLPRRHVLPSLMLMAGSLAIPVLIGMRPIAGAAAAQNWGMMLLWILLAVTAGLVGSWIVFRLNALPSRVLWMGLAGLLGAAAIGLAILLVTRPVDQVIPASVSRLADISLETDNAQNRLEFTRDALRAFQDQPWGYGGTGWDRTYRRYQQANYISRETHNHYSQTLVEAGALGFLALIGAIGASLWTAYRSRGEDSLRWTMAVAGSLLALHASVDVDLSFFYLWLLMWVLLAAGLPPVAADSARKEKGWIRWSATGASLLVGVLGINLVTAAYAFQKAERALLRQDAKTALDLGRTAIQLDPWNSQHLRFVATEANLRKAVRVDPYNPLLWRDLHLNRIRAGDLPGARQAAQKAIEYQPMSVQNYIALAQATGLSLDQALAGGRRDEALTLARELVELGAQVEQRGAVAAPIQKRFPTYPKLELTPPLHLAVGKGLLLTGAASEAEPHLAQALADKATQAEAAIWLHALYTRQGNSAAFQAMPVQPTPDSLGGPVYLALLNWK